VGVTVNWTGGAAGSYVVIGGSSANSTSGISGSFSCFAPVAALTFTVPNFILLNLPAVPAPWTWKTPPPGKLHRNGHRSRLQLRRHFYFHQLHLQLRSRETIS